MAKSRMARRLSLMALAPWFLAVPAAAQTASDAGTRAVAEQQEAVRDLVRDACPGEGDEIVICRRRIGADRHRLPLAQDLPPGAADAADAAGGEQLAAMGAGDDRCSPVGRAQQCNGGIDLIGAGFMVARILAKALIEGRD